jgi:dipeptidyl aminopeptidase/acylaminoacyl peptidase
VHQASRCMAFVAAALFALPLALSAQTKSDHLVPYDIFRLQYSTEPQISPDARRIVYVRQSANVMEDKRESNLWMVNFDGSDDRPLTTGHESDTSPHWSPDGTRLAYLSDADGHTQLYIRWMDTGQTARLTDLESAPGGIAWSPDGKQIAFAAQVASPGPRLATVPATPPGAKWADPPRMFDTLIYRFNGVGYLRPGTAQIFVVAADGGAPRQVSRGDSDFGSASQTLPNLVWSADGADLLLSANLHPDHDYEPEDTEVYELALADGAVKQLTHRKGPDNSPVLSPDGKSIAYTGFDDRYQGHQTTQLYVMDRDGSNPHVITAKLDRDVVSPRWSPSGNGIYFLYDDQGDTKLAFTDLSGSTRIIAQHVGNGAGAGGGGASFSLDPRGRFFATTFTQPENPGGIVAGSFTDNSAPRLLVQPNRELVTQKPLGKVEEIWFNSSLDQKKIQGWIIKPPDFDASKKYPLILEIHGGPFANYGDRFDLEKQLYAGMGYVVLYLNPRGSTSYGEEFANLIHHAYPGDDFSDLNSGVDAVVAKGYVDPNNLFVTGGSGGGVLTCWMIDRTTRFRAAASDYPVINWYSWTLTADIPITGSKYWFPGPPWEYPDQYMNRSVINHVKDVKTPTLLMTGEEDFRTPISEAEQFYEALKLLKVDAMLVRFPGEPHGLSRRPSHQMTKVMYIAAWFDRHKSK